MFDVTLPAAQAALQTDAPAAPEPAVAPVDASRCERAGQILYIEDNLSNLTLVEEMLAEHSGIELLTAMEGGLGIEMARQHSPDLILLDLHLPDMLGHEVLARLRHDPSERPRLPWQNKGLPPGQCRCLRP